MTGNWGGLRDRLLKEYGVSFLAAYSGQPAANLRGGLDRGASYKGDLSLSLFADMNRLMGWKGGYFLASYTYKNSGKSLSSDYIGNQFPVQLDNGDEGGVSRLVHLALGQVFWDNAVEIVAGRIITGEDFASLPMAATSVNQAICANPIAGNQSISFPTYPSAVWGARIKAKPHSNWYAQVGSYRVFEDFRSVDTSGFDFTTPDGSGLLTLGEFGYVTGTLARQSGLPGVYKGGGYYDGERVKELSTGRDARGTWGIYALAQQMVYSENKDHTLGLTVWSALCYAPPDRNTISFMAAGGLSYQGLIPGRPWDRASFIGAYGGFSGDPNGTTLHDRTFEGLLEVNYRYQPAVWLFIQPDIQYVMNPDGRTDINDALVISLAFGLTF
jgi:porin